MNIKYNPKALNFLSQKDIKAISSNEELQQKISDMFGCGNFDYDQKVRYIKKLIAIKVDKKEKRNYSIKELLKIIPIPQRIQRTLRKIRKKNYEQFIRLHKDITKIVVDPSKNDMTKLDRIKKLLWNLSNKRKSGITYNTYNQQLMLALIAENSGIDRKQLRTKMQVQEKAVMRNLKKLQEESLLVETKHRRKFLYTLSEKGKLQADELTLSFLNRGNSNAFEDTHFKNDSVEKKELLCSERIAATKQVDRKLRNLGIYGPRVREFLEKYSLERIVELYNKVIHQDRIENKGAYIYKVLSDSCPKSLRIRSFVNFHLRGVLSRDVCNMFSQEAQSLSMHIAMWLGHSLKRLAKKITVLPCNVHVALHRIYKQIAGTTNYSKPATAHSKTSYVERNRAYELMRIEEEKNRLQYC